MTPEAWEQWLATAPGGSEIVYCVASVLDPKSVTPETLAVAERAKFTYAQGLVELVQRLRKDAKGKRAFEYLAIKKHRVRVPTANGEPWQAKIIGQNKVPLRRVA